MRTFLVVVIAVVICLIDDPAYMYLEWFLIGVQITLTAEQLLGQHTKRVWETATKQLGEPIKKEEPNEK